MQDVYKRKHNWIVLISLLLSVRKKINDEMLKSNDTEIWAVTFKTANQCASTRQCWEPWLDKYIARLGLKIICQ
jgi:hypothetical protein